MFLTGAGASVPLGLFTTRQFLEHFSNEGYKRLVDSAGDAYSARTTSEIDAIRQALSKGEDIEDVLSRVEQQGQAAQLLLEDNAPGLQLPAQVREQLKEYQASKERVANAIYDEVVAQYGSALGDEAAELYRDMFQGFPRWFADVPRLGQTLPFFTLNYDLAVESAASALGHGELENGYMHVRLVDGVADSPGAVGRRWNRNEFLHYVEDESRVNVVLVKLHGSIRWGRRDARQGSYIAELPPDVARNPAPYRQALFYPTLAVKPITEEPFRTGYQCFRACLRSTKLLIAIGTSLRDIEINAELRDAMDANDQLYIVVVDPAAKHEEVAIKLECDPSRVAVVKVEFGWPIELLMGVLRQFARLACTAQQVSRVHFGGTFESERLARVPGN